MRVISQADPYSFANGRSFRRAHIMITRKISELLQQLLHSLQNGDLVGMGFQRRARRRELAARVAEELTRPTAPPHHADRQSVVEGKSVHERVDTGGRRSIQKK